MYSYFRRALYNNDDFEVSFSCSRTKTRSLRVTRRVLCGRENMDASYIYISFLRKIINKLSVIQFFFQKCHFAKRCVYGFHKKVRNTRKTSSMKRQQNVTCIWKLYLRSTTISTTLRTKRATGRRRTLNLKGKIMHHYYNQQ